MNIGIFTDTYKPDINGVTTSIEAFCGELEKQGHRVFIFAPNQSLSYKAMPQKRIWLAPSIKFYGEKRYRIALPFPEWQDWLKLPLDIVHTQTPFGLGIIGLRIANKLKIPAVHTYHTFYEEYAHYLHLPPVISKPLAKRLVKIMAQQFLNRHDAIISPSLGMKRIILKYGLKKPVHVIPTGIDLEKTSRIAEIINTQNILRKLGLSANDEIIVLTSRLGKEKNIGFILRAMKLVKKTNQRAKLLVIGDGSEKVALQNLAKTLGLQREVIFTGFMNHEAIFALYKVAKVFVFSSLTETQGLVVLEAMAMGLPVVALQAMGIEDIMAGNKGGFMTEKNVVAFSQKIDLLLENRKVHAQKKGWALKLAKGFSLTEMTRRLLSVYKYCIKLKRPARADNLV